MKCEEQILNITCFLYFADYKCTKLHLQGGPRLSPVVLIKWHSYKVT